MADFNVVAELQVRLSKASIAAASRQLQSQLGGSNGINVGINPASLQNLSRLQSQIGNIGSGLKNTSQAAAQFNKTFQTIGTSAGAAASNLEQFGRQAGLAARRFTAFSLGAGAVVGLFASIGTGIREAIAFEKEMVRISQVSGDTIREIRKVESGITKLATSLGVSSKELASAAVIFKQAGISTRELAGHLDTLAQSALAPNFDSMAQTAEGMIAVLRQFNTDVEGTRKAIGSMNAVAGAFAVESSDLITAVTKAGGAFKQTGGNLNELLALFTSVRSTTRESAESIATGLRTIFTRLQRGSTVEALKDLQINLRYTNQEARNLNDVNLENQFVGAYEAVRRLSQGLSQLRTSDARYSAIIEELGGYRQISRVIPLIQQFGSESERALRIAEAGSVSLASASEKAQSSLANRLEKTKENFLDLFRTIVQDDSFQNFTRAVLGLADGFVDLLGAAKPVLPLLTGIAAIKLTQSLIPVSRGIVQTAANISNITPRRLSTGGVVPGTGDTDKIPAMLTPGEFVMRKDAVQEIGLANMQRLNVGGKKIRFLNQGGPAQKDFKYFENLLQEGKVQEFEKEFFASSIFQRKIQAAFRAVKTKGTAYEFPEDLSSDITLSLLPNVREGKFRKEGNINLSGLISFMARGKTVDEARKLNRQRQVSADAQIPGTNASIVSSIEDGADKIDLAKVTAASSQMQAEQERIQLERELYNNSGFTNLVDERQVSQPTVKPPKPKSEKAIQEARRLALANDWRYGKGVVDNLGPNFPFPSSNKKEFLVNFLAEKQALDIISGNLPKELDAAGNPIGSSPIRPSTELQGTADRGGNALLLQKIVELENARLRGDDIAQRFQDKYPDSGLSLPRVPNSEPATIKKNLKKYRGYAEKLGVSLEDAENPAVIPPRASRSKVRDKMFGRSNIAVAAKQAVLPQPVVDTEGIQQRNQIISGILGGAITQKQAQENLSSPVSFEPYGPRPLQGPPKPLDQTQQRKQQENLTSKVSFPPYGPRPLQGPPQLSPSSSVFFPPYGPRPLQGPNQLNPSSPVSFPPYGPLPSQGPPRPPLPPPDLAPSPDKQAIIKKLSNLGYDVDPNTSYTTQELSKYYTQVNKLGSLNKLITKRGGRQTLLEGDLDDSAIARGVPADVVEKGRARGGVIGGVALSNKRSFVTRAGVTGKSAGANTPVHEQAHILDRIYREDYGERFSESDSFRNSILSLKGNLVAADKDGDPSKNKELNYLNQQIEKNRNGTGSGTNQEILAEATALYIKGGKSRKSLGDFGGVIEGFLRGTLNGSRFGGGQPPLPPAPPTPSGPEDEFKKQQEANAGLKRLTYQGPISKRLLRDGFEPSKLGNTNNRTTRQLLGLNNTDAFRIGSLLDNETQSQFNAAGSRFGGKIPKGLQEKALDDAGTNASAKVKSDLIKAEEQLVKKIYTGITDEEALHLARENARKAIEKNQKVITDLNGKILGTAASYNQNIKKNGLLAIDDQAAIASVGRTLSGSSQSSNLSGGSKGGGGSLTNFSTLITDNANSTFRKEIESRGGNVPEDVKKALAERILNQEQEKVSKQLLEAERRNALALPYLSRDPNIRAEEAETIAQQRAKQGSDNNENLVTDASGNILGTKDSVKEHINNTGSAPAIPFGDRAKSRFRRFSGGVGSFRDRYRSFIQNRTPFGSPSFQIGASIVAPVASQFLEGQAGDATQAVSGGSGSQSRFRGLRAGSGLIQGALLGGFAGATVGAGVPGAVIGGLVGVASSLKATQKEIQEVKIGEALNKLSANINRVSALGAQSSPGLQQDAIRSIRDLEKNNLDKSIAESGGFFGGLFGSDNESFVKSQESSFRSSYENILPQIVDNLSKQASELGKANLSTPVKELVQQLQGGAGELNNELFRIAAQFNDNGLTGVLADYEKSIKAAQVAEQNRLDRIDSGNTESKLINSFDRLILAVTSASDGLDGMRQSISGLEQLFDGNFSPNSVRLGSQNNQLGRNDRGALEGAGVIGSIGGEYGRRIQARIGAADQVANELPSILSEIAKTGSATDQNDFAVEARAKLTEKFKDSTGKVPDEILEVINGISSTLRDGDLSGIYNEVENDVSKLTENLLAPWQALADNGQKIVEQVEANANGFAAGISTYVKMLESNGKILDNLSRLQSSNYRQRLEIEAGRSGRSRQTVDLLDIDQVNAGFDRTNARLVGNGVNGNSPDDISKAFSETLQGIRDAEKRQSDAAVSTVGGRDGKEFETATTELEQLKQKAVNLKTALENLADASQRNAVLQEKLASIREEEDSRLGLAEQFIRADPQERQGLNRGLGLTVLAQKNPELLRKLSTEDRNRVFDTLDSAGSTSIFGEKAGDLKDRLIKSIFGGTVLNDNQNTTQKKLEDELLGNNKVAEQAAQKLYEVQTTLSQNYFDEQRKLQKEFFDRLAKELIQNKVTDIKNQEGTLSTKEREVKDLKSGEALLAGIGVKDDKGLNTLKDNSKLIEEYASNLKKLQEQNRTLGKIGGQKLSDVAIGDGVFASNQVIGQKKGLLDNYLGSEYGLNEKQRGLVLDKYDSLIGENNVGLISQDPETKNKATKNITDGIAGVIREQILSSDSRKKLEADYFETKKILSDIQGLDISKFNKQISENSEAFKKALDAFSSTGTTLEDLPKKIELLNSEIKNLKDSLSAASSGQVTAATGGLIFTPRGTDTVPAMLTPGEFVINRQSTEANLPLLRKINNAKGSLYLAEGGIVGGDDKERRERALQRQIIVQDHNREAVERLRGKKTEGPIQSLFDKLYEFEKEKNDELYGSKEGYQKHLDDLKNRNYRTYGKIDPTEGFEYESPSAKLNRELKERGESNEKSRIADVDRKQKLYDELHAKNVEKGFGEGQAFASVSPRLILSPGITRGESYEEYKDRKNRSAAISGRRVNNSFFNKSQEEQDALIRNDRTKKPYFHSGPTSAASGNALSEKEEIEFNRRRKLLEDLRRKQEDIALKGNQNPTQGDYDVAIAEGAVERKSIIPPFYRDNRDSKYKARQLARSGGSRPAGVNYRDQYASALRNLSPEQKRDAFFNRRRAIYGFASGGIVPGIGDSDMIDARLTPGEFVLTKGAANRIGHKKLEYYNNGGVVGSGSTGGGVDSVSLSKDSISAINTFTSSANTLGQSFSIMSESVKEFNNAMNTFTVNTTSLSAAIAAMPKSMTGEFSHNVNVNVNGAEVMGQLMPEIKNLIVTETKNQLNKVFAENMPDANIRT